MNEIKEKAEEYLVNHFCKKVDEEYKIEECNSGERIRCISFEERIEMLVEFANEITKEMREEGEKIFNDWLEACNKYGIVNLRLTEAKEIIKKFLLWENSWHKKTESKYELLKQAETFLKG